MLRSFSRLGHERRSHLRIPRPRKNHRRRDEHDATPDDQSGPVLLRPQNGACRRLADEHAESDECKAHAQPRAQHALVWRNAGHNRNRQRDKGPRHEAVDVSKRQDAGGGLDRQQAEGQDAGEQAEDDLDVERAEGAGDVVGEQAAEERAGVEDGEEVEGEVGVGAGDLDSIQLNVVVEDVEAKEADEEAETAQEVWQVLQVLEVDDLALAGVSHDAHAHQGEGDEHGGEDHETDDAHGPGEADLGSKLLQHDGVDDSTWSGLAMGSVELGEQDSPMLDPVVAMPTANDPLVENHWDTMADAGMKTKPNPTPVTTAWARKNW